MTCQPTPCQGRGDCAIDELGAFCHCQDLYEGLFCQYDKGHTCEQTGTVCQNGGTCVVSERGNITCVCAEGFTGNLCEGVVNASCAPNPCNYGACILDVAGNIHCVCPPGSTGQYCAM